MLEPHVATQTRKPSRADAAQLAAFLGGRSFEACRERFAADGYLVFEDVLSRAQVEKLRGALSPLLENGPRGRNEFEGQRSNRCYALLAKHEAFAELVTHPLALAFAEAELGASCLLSACLAINLLPGETAQPWHFDDSHLHVPRPRAAFGVSAFWALDETTAQNGATQILPGSHLWPTWNIPGSTSSGSFDPGAAHDASAPDPGARDDALTVCLPAGGLMLAQGTLWHRGGANRSRAARLIVTPQYCPGWARQLENMLLAVPPAKAARLPERARELLGYSIHPPFMGYVDGMHPRRSLPR